MSGGYLNPSGGGYLNLGASSPSYTFTGTGPHLVHETGAPIVFSSDLVPDADNTLDLGSNSKRIANVYCAQILTGNANTGITVLTKRNAGSTAPDLTLRSVNTRTAGDLLDVWNNTTSKFKIDFAGIVDIAGSLQVAGTQVVGARVVDARIDDAINSGDATTDGVIDAIRDILITHGLVAAA